MIPLTGVKPDYVSRDVTRSILMLKRVVVNVLCFDSGKMFILLAVNFFNLYKESASLSVLKNLQCLFFLEVSTICTFKISM